MALYLKEGLAQGLENNHCAFLFLVASVLVPVPLMAKKGCSWIQWWQATLSVNHLFILFYLFIYQAIYLVSFSLCFKFNFLE